MKPTGEFGCCPSRSPLSSLRTVCDGWYLAGQLALDKVRPENRLPRVSKRSRCKQVGASKPQTDLRPGLSQTGARLRKEQRASPPTARRCAKSVSVGSLPKITTSGNLADGL